MTEADRLTDSTRVADSIATHFCLENLLLINSEERLQESYGYDKVSYDTLWGAEGFFSMGTILRTDSLSHIEITWKNPGVKAGIISATLVSESDWYGDTSARGDWRSCSGVYLGMSVNDLQKLNGRPFTFSGFGWDYAGGVISWNGGTLEGKGIAVQLSEAPATLTWTPEQSAQMLGDVEVHSDNPLLKDIKPRVWSISVAKVQ